VPTPDIPEAMSLLGSHKSEGDELVPKPTFNPASTAIANWVLTLEHGGMLDPLGVDYGLPQHHLNPLSSLKSVLFEHFHAAANKRMQTAANKWAMMRISQVYTRLAARAPEQDDDNKEPEPQGTAGKRRG
jgi:hypothetical protein